MPLKPFEIVDGKDNVDICHGVRNVSHPQIKERQNQDDEEATENCDDETNGCVLLTDVLKLLEKKSAAVPCSLHSTPDDLAHADRLRTETHRGLNENLAGALVTVGPLSKKDLPFSQICDKFHENVTIFDLT